MSDILQISGYSSSELKNTRIVKGRIQGFHELHNCSVTTVRQENGSLILVYDARINGRYVTKADVLK